MNKNFRGFAPILVVVVIIGGIFLVEKGKLNSIINIKTPVPNTSLNLPANLKTYNGTSYPYQISYPGEFIHDVRDDITGDQERVNFSNTKTDELLSSFMVSVLKANLPTYTGKYTVANIEGVYVQFPNGAGPGEGGIPSINVFIKKGDVLYGFTFRGTTDIKNTTVVQILSSFKFTN